MTLELCINYIMLILIKMSLCQTCFLETQSGVIGFCFYHGNMAYEREMIQLNLSLVQWNTGRVFALKV